MHSISDLTTTCTRTAGHVPPRLVGASTTVVGSKMYLFGGRLVAERTMVSELHIFDLKTSTWEELRPADAEDEMPPARYFHSADPWENTIVIFGGMGNNPDSPDPEDLIVLNDLWIYDIWSGRWRSGTAPGTDVLAGPRARYAHLSAVTAQTLYIIGGQDINNVWLDDVCAYDLRQGVWVSRRPYPRHCGTYRSVAVACPLAVVTPKSSAAADAGFDIVNTPTTPPDALVHLPYSVTPPDDMPSDIYLYSNYNFTDVRRELEVFTPIPGTDAEFQITDRSGSMSGTSLPPGLRFPAGAVLGNHLVLTGTYLAHSFQTYSVWALDLTTNVWHRIEPGTPLTSGSWFRSCLWADDNKLVVFGDRHGSLVEDYNRRLLCWDYVCTIDLEAFGVYQPPRAALGVPAQVLGLSALEGGLLADFELIAEDGRKVPVSRRLLEERWPWFCEQRKKFEEQARRTAATLPASESNISLPATATPASGLADPFLDVNGNDTDTERRPDPRLTPRAFYLTEPYPITLALAQYFYAQALITPLQHAPAVLSQLLVLSSLYNLEHLHRLTAHAMHRVLSKSTSVGIYEVATLSSCRSLQIRALKMVMAYNSKKTGGRTKRQKERDDTDHNGRGGQNGHGDGGGGGGGNGTGTGTGTSGGRRDDHSAAARPRGMSDASFMHPSFSGGGSQQSYAGGYSYQTDSRQSQETLRPVSGVVSGYAPSPIAGPSEMQELFHVEIDPVAVGFNSSDSSPDHTTTQPLRIRAHTASQHPAVISSPAPAGPERYRAQTISHHAAYHLPVRPRPTPLDTSEGVTASSSTPAAPATSPSSIPATPALLSTQLSISPLSATSSPTLQTPTTGSRGAFSPGIARSPPRTPYEHIQQQQQVTIRPPPRTSSKTGLKHLPSLSALAEAARLGSESTGKESTASTSRTKPTTPAMAAQDLPLKDVPMVPALSPFSGLAMHGAGRF